VGSASTILVTDVGPSHNLTLTQGLENYVGGLPDHGFSAAEIRPMVGEHARAILDI